MKIKRQVATLLTFLLLSSAALADDVYVKNKLFKGQVQGAGQNLSVDAKDLLTALGISDYTIKNGLLIVGKSKVTLNGGFVLLKDIAEATGAKVVVNAALGTVDVYQSTEKKAYTPTVAEEKPKRSRSREYSAGGWKTDFAQGVRMAKSSNKPILLYFTGSDW